MVIRAGLRGSNCGQRCGTTASLGWESFQPNRRIPPTRRCHWDIEGTEDTVGIVGTGDTVDSNDPESDMAGGMARAWGSSGMAEGSWEIRHPSRRFGGCCDGCFDDCHTFLRRFRCRGHTRRHCPCHCRENWSGLHTLHPSQQPKRSKPSNTPRPRQGSRRQL